MANVHAGLEKGEFNVLSFNSEDQLVSLLYGIGCSVKEERVLNPEGVANNCDVCHTDIRLSTLGHVLPGSTLFLCDDPSCLASYITKHTPEAKGD